MKITIEPTQDHIAGNPGDMQHTVVIEHPSDDLGLADAVELMARALKAWGYSETGVDELIPPR